MLPDKCLYNSQYSNNYSTWLNYDHVTFFQPILNLVVFFFFLWSLSSWVLLSLIALVRLSSYCWSWMYYWSFFFQSFLVILTWYYCYRYCCKDQVFWSRILDSLIKKTFIKVFWVLVLFLLGKLPHKHSWYIFWIHQIVADLFGPWNWLFF